MRGRKARLLCCCCYDDGLIVDRCLSYIQYTQPLYRRQSTLRIVHCSPVESFSKVRHPLWTWEETALWGLSQQKGVEGERCWIIAVKKGGEGWSRGRDGLAEECWRASGFCQRLSVTSLLRKDEDIHFNCFVILGINCRGPIKIWCILVAGHWLGEE